MIDLIKEILKNRELTLIEICKLLHTKRYVFVHGYIDFMVENNILYCNKVNDYYLFYGVV